MSDQKKPFTTANMVIKSTELYPAAPKRMWPSYIRPPFPDLPPPPGMELRWARYSILEDESDELDVDNLKQYISDGWHVVPNDHYPLTEAERCCYAQKGAVMGRGLILLCRSTLPDTTLTTLRQQMIEHWGHFNLLPVQQQALEQTKPSE